MKLTIDELYLNELLTQCEYAEFAINDSETHLQNTPQKDIRKFWYSIQALLISIANISKILWPNQQNKDRGTRLRKLLCIPDDSPLKPRTFRNHFEHYDERIQEWFDTDRPPGFADFCIGPDTSFGGGLKKPHYMRNFNPETCALYFRGDEYMLKPVIEALDELKQSLSKEI